MLGEGKNMKNLLKLNYGKFNFGGFSDERNINSK